MCCLSWNHKRRIIKLVIYRSAATIHIRAWYLHRMYYKSPIFRSLMIVNMCEKYVYLFRVSVVMALSCSFFHALAGIDHGKLCKPNSSCRAWRWAGNTSNLRYKPGVPCNTCSTVPYILISYRLCSFISSSLDRFSPRSEWVMNAVVNICSAIVMAWNIGPIFDFAGCLNGVVAFYKHGANCIGMIPSKFMHFLSRHIGKPTGKHKNRTMHTRWTQA